MYLVAINMIRNLKNIWLKKRAHMQVPCHKVFMMMN